MNSNLFTSFSGRACQCGFTLIEVLIVLAIASVLFGAGVPSLRNIIRSMELTSATNDLFGSLMLARSEAAKHGRRVALCKSSNGVTCATSGGWEQGWIVFHDTNNNGVHDAGEEIVMRAQALPADMRLAGNLNVAKYVSYAPTGETKLASGAFQAGTITLCNQSGARENARQIIISSSGRPRVQKTQVASCV
jgi:type IV fimbrial biogenesis protein FimT